MDTEATVRYRLAELGISETITPLVLERIKKLHEAKALGSKKLKPDREKQNDIEDLQSEKGFKASALAHARRAGKEINKNSDELGSHLNRLYNLYIDKEISLESFKNRSRIAIKEQTIEAFKLGVKSAGLVTNKGTLLGLTSDESQWIGTYLKEEFKYFDKLVDGISSGEVSPKQALNRLWMYASTIKSAYESGRVLSYGTNIIIYWVLESHTPCPDCKYLHRQSPFLSDTLPTVPKGGQTRCLSHCYCSLKFVKSSQAEIDKVRKKNKSSSWHLQQIKKNRKKR